MSINPKIIFVMLFVFSSTVSFAQNERWVYRYSGASGWQNDCAEALCCGLDGNLYAGGYTWNTGTNEDFAVISLTNSGSERWIYRYLSSGNNWDECYSICYGNDGNIYAAGACTGSDTSLHYFTVISLTTGGTERWVYQFPQSSSANSVCFGSDGNIYAVGNTQGRILVVSLDINGNERWTYVYSTPSSESNPGQSITCGLDGNVYVAGYTGPIWNTDVIVISLTPSGSERWVYFYNGPGGTYDYGKCIIYGQDENLYVFGSTCYLVGPGYVYSQGLAISLTTSSSERWAYISPADPSGFGCGIFGADGNLYAAGAYGWDFPFFFVESISDSGTYRWHYIDTTWSFAMSITYGDDDNIYAGGTTTDNSSGEDYFTIMSFTSDSTLRWIYKYRRPGIAADYNATHSVVYGEDGNIYAAGGTQDSITGVDFTVISLSSEPGVNEVNKTGKPAGLDLMITPSVVYQKAQLHIHIPTQQNIDLKVYDITGREILTEAIGNITAGKHIYNLDIINLSSGVYFVKLKGENEERTKKILIIK